MTEPLAQALFLKATENLTLSLEQEGASLIVPVGAIFELLGTATHDEEKLLVRHMLTGWRLMVPRGLTTPYDHASPGAPQKPKLKLAQ